VRLFPPSTYSVGGELSYIISYLSSLRSVPYKHLPGRQQYDVDSLNLVAEERDGEEVVQSVSPDPLGVGFRLQCESYGVGRLSGIAYPSNW
jgi:hypothetical protein